MNDSALFPGEGAVEMLDEQEIDAEPRDLALLDAKRRQTERLAPRHEDAARVRLEGQHRHRRAARLGERAGLADQRRMALVQPVEIAHRQHRAALMLRTGARMTDDAQSGQGGVETPQ